MFGKIKNYFKDDKDYEDDDYDEDDYEEDYEEEEYDRYEDDEVEEAVDYGREEFNLNSVRSKKVEMLLVSPVTFNEAIKIANDLKKNRIMVVNLDDVEFEEGRKIVDFLSGTIYAIGGSVNKISGKIIVFAPGFVDVQNTISFRKKEKGMDVPSFRRV